MPILVTCECGKQFQAKDENVGRRFNCPNCGREVAVPKPEAGSYTEPMFEDFAPAKTSGKAITSLVLGILSFFCTFFTGIPAIIFGALGLSDVGKSKGRVQGQGLAIAGIVMGSLGSLMMIPVLIALLLPAVQAAREAARRAQCVNNLKQIGLAMHNYESATGSFPAAAISNPDGKPLLSWRVAILPYIEEQALFDQFKLDEPWDGPNNIKLLDKMPKTYACPSDPKQVGTKQTKYQVVVGPGTMFDGLEGTKINQVTDGTSNTLLVVEAVTPVEWSKPDDIDVAQALAAIGSYHPGGANALFADGSVRFLKKSVPPQIMQSLMTRQGGEVITSDAY